MTRSRPRAGEPPGSFAARALAVVARIPVGRVLTYGDVARLAGRAAAARAVGQIMRTASRPGLPYHRVVGAGGTIGGYGGSPAIKAAMLRAEGLRIAGSRIGEFARHRWNPDGRATSRRAATSK